MLLRKHSSIWDTETETNSYLCVHLHSPTVCFQRIYICRLYIQYIWPQLASASPYRWNEVFKPKLSRHSGVLLIIITHRPSRSYPAINGGLVRLVFTRVLSECSSWGFVFLNSHRWSHGSVSCYNTWVQLLPVARDSRAIVRKHAPAHRSDDFTDAHQHCFNKTDVKWFVCVGYLTDVRF